MDQGTTTPSPMQHLTNLCTFNLHLSNCRMADQETVRGHAHSENELWTEALMGLVKRRTRPLLTNHPEEVVSRYLVEDMVLAHLAATQPGCQPLERWTPGHGVDQYVGPLADDASGEVGMLQLGKAVSAVQWEEFIRPKIEVCLKDDGAVGGLTAACLMDLRLVAPLDRMEPGTCHVVEYEVAIIHDYEKVATATYGRERTRRSCYVQVSILQPVMYPHALASLPKMSGTAGDMGRGGGSAGATSEDRRGRGASHRPEGVPCHHPAPGARHCTAGGSRGRRGRRGHSTLCLVRRLQRPCVAA